MMLLQTYTHTRTFIHTRMQTNIPTPATRINYKLVLFLSASWQLTGRFGAALWVKAKLVDVLKNYVTIVHAHFRCTADKLWLCGGGGDVAVKTATKSGTPALCHRQHRHSGNEATRQWRIRLKSATHVNLQESFTSPLALASVFTTNIMIYWNNKQVIFNHNNETRASYLNTYTYTHTYICKYILLNYLIKLNILINFDPQHLTTTAFPQRERERERALGKWEIN